MSERDDIELFKEHAAEIEAAAARLRAVGTPLPAGANRPASSPPAEAHLPQSAPFRPERPMTPERSHPPEPPVPSERQIPMGGQVSIVRPIPVVAAAGPLQATQPEPLISQGRPIFAQRPAAPERPLVLERAVPVESPVRTARPPQPERPVPAERAVSPERPGAHPPVEPVDLPGVQRAASILRTVLPVVQRLMPLFDRKAGPADKPASGAPTQPQPTKHLAARLSAPIEETLAELRLHQHSFRLQLAEQNASIKRIEERLEKVREATDRNTLEQQELLDELKSLGRYLRITALVALVLATGGFCLALALFLQLYKLQL